MKKEVMFFILLISLAFNLAFIGMFIWHRSHFPHFEEGPDFPHIRKSFQSHPDHLKSRRQEFIDDRRIFMDCIRSEEFVETQADSLLQNMLDKQYEMEKTLGKEMIEMRKKGEFIDDRFNRLPHERKNNPERRRK